METSDITITNKIRKPLGMWPQDTAKKKLLYKVPKKFCVI